MKPGVKVEGLRDASRVLRLYERATNKSCADILNRYTRNVIMWAIRMTEKTPVGKIRRETNPEKKPILWKIAAKRGFKKGEGIKAEVDRMYTQRQNSRGFIAAGFLRALRAFGGRGGGRNVQLQNEALHGKGRKATTGRLVARFDNTADEADTIAGPAVVRAQARVLDDMEQYAQRKIQGQRF